MKRSVLLFVMFLLAISVASADDWIYCEQEDQYASYPCKADYSYNVTGIYKCYCDTDLQVCTLHNPCKHKKVGSMVTAVSPTGIRNVYRCDQACQLQEVSTADGCDNDQDCDMVEDHDDLCSDSRGLVDRDGCSCSQKTDHDCEEIDGIECCNHCELEIKQRGDGTIDLMPVCKEIELPDGEEDIIDEDAVTSGSQKADRVGESFSFPGSLSRVSPQECHEYRDGDGNVVDRTCTEAPEKCGKWDYGISGECTWECTRDYVPIVYKTRRGDWYGTCQERDWRRIRECPSDFVWGTCAVSTSFHEDAFAGVNIGSRDDFKGSPEYWDKRCGDDRKACFSTGDKKGVNCYVFNNDYSAGPYHYCYNGKMVERFWFHKTGIRTFSEGDAPEKHEYIVKLGDLNVVIQRPTASGIDGYLGGWDGECYSTHDFKGPQLGSCGDYENNWEYWDNYCDAGNAYCIKETGSVRCISLRSGSCGTGGTCINGACTGMTNSDLSGESSDLCATCGAGSEFSDLFGLTNECTPEFCESIGEGKDYACEYRNGDCIKVAASNDPTQPVSDEPSSGSGVRMTDLDNNGWDPQCYSSVRYSFSKLENNYYHNTGKTVDLSSCHTDFGASEGVTHDYWDAVMSKSPGATENTYAYCDDSDDSLYAITFKEGEPCDGGLCNFGECMGANVDQYCQAPDGMTCYSEGKQVTRVKIGSEAGCFPSKDGIVKYGYIAFCNDSGEFDDLVHYCALPKYSTIGAGAGSGVGAESRITLGRVEFWELGATGNFNKEGDHSINIRVECKLGNSGHAEWITIEDNLGDDYDGFYDFISAAKVPGLVKTTCSLPSEMHCYNGSEEKVADLLEGETAYCLDAPASQQDKISKGYSAVCQEDGTLKKTHYCRIPDKLSNLICSASNKEVTPWGDFIRKGQTATCAIAEKDGRTGMRVVAECQPETPDTWDYKFQCKVLSVLNWNCEPRMGSYVDQGEKVDCASVDRKYHVHTRCKVSHDGSKYVAEFPDIDPVSCPKKDHSSAIKNLQTYYDYSEGRCCFTAQTCKDNGWCTTNTAGASDKCGGTINCDAVC